ncbi:hypothetical protein BDFG_08442 [Blastomyces dermatitidis ATCC 26199]|nr:hypothetical protein BDFG_08442 [Blastomyces dermatitidis ATCC 26199]
MSSSSYMIGIPGGDQHWCCMLGWSYPSLIPQAPVFACMGSAFPGSKLPMLPVQDNGIQETSANKGTLCGP